MVRKQILLNDKKASHLKAIALRTGKKESDLVEAVEKFLDDQKSEKSLNDFMSACGIWKSRKDLPDFRKIRKSLDRTFKNQV